MSYKLFLDDERQPQQCYEYMVSRIEDPSIYIQNWVVVKNYNEFVEVIEKEGIPDLISFDHDLADIHYNPSTWTESFVYQEKTGYDCAKWLVDYCIETRQILSEYHVHSMNPIGTERILSLLNSYKRNEQEVR